MKKLINLLLIIMFAAGITYDVQAAPVRKKARTTKKAAPRNTTKFTELPNPAADPANPCNQGEESLMSFIEMWKQNSAFRNERSKDVKFGFYDEDTNKVEFNEDMEVNVFKMYCGEYTQKDWDGIFKIGKTTIKKGRDIQLIENEWRTVQANLAVLNCNEEYGYGGEIMGGSSMNFIFARKDGKWYLIGFSAAG